MAYPVRMVPSDLMISPGDSYLPPVATPRADSVYRSSLAAVQPVTAWQSVLAWLATFGLLILLAAGTLVAAVVWFFALFFAKPQADEAAGE